jgi:acetyltransferase-like isoleucine patch superfamily enzyme
MFRQRLKRRAFALVCRVVQVPRIWLFSLMSNGRSQGKPHCQQPLQLVGAGLISFENNVHIGVFPSPLFFSSYAYIEARNPGARVAIGENTWINNNFCAVAEHTSITIGRDCLIGSSVEILDSDFHGMQLADRDRSLAEWAAPVLIGNNVFIGSNAKIMKGTSIGDGAVVANGALVVSDVLPNTVVGGVPARVIRTIA